MLKVFCYGGSLHGQIIEIDDSATGFVHDSACQETYELVKYPNPECRYKPAFRILVHSSVTPPDRLLPAQQRALANWLERMRCPTWK